MAVQHTCPRRIELGSVAIPGPDTWDEGTGNCSFCGSMNPDTFMARLEAGDIELGPTDKDYKVYVRNLGGAPLQTVKFYFQHLSVEQRKRFVELLNAKALKFDPSGRFYVLPFFCQRKPVDKKGSE